MKRIEIMAKMDEQNVAEEIIDFLQDHDLIDKSYFWCEGEKLDAIYGLAQYLGEEVAECSLI